jgi:hypothetical protein
MKPNIKPRPLGKIRCEKRLSQEQLTRESRMKNKSIYSHIERGIVEADQYQKESLARALGVSVSDIAWGEHNISYSVLRSRGSYIKNGSSVWREKDGEAETSPALLGEKKIKLQCELCTWKKFDKTREKQEDWFCYIYYKSPAEKCNCFISKANLTPKDLWKQKKAGQMAIKKSKTPGGKN